MRGACDPLFTPRPLGPFLDIAGQVGGRFAELVQGGVKPHEALPAFLGELGAGGTVAVIEDLHWADEASLDLLGLAACRIDQVAALLRSLYTRLGITAERPIIAYCRIGERSAHTWFALTELLGYPAVKNYDGSWTEYGSLVAVPVEMG